jgi:hypothetical protein
MWTSSAKWVSFLPATFMRPMVLRTKRPYRWYCHTYIQGRKTA